VRVCVYTQAEIPPLVGPLVATWRCPSLLNNTEGQASGHHKAMEDHQASGRPRAIDADSSRQDPPTCTMIALDHRTEDNSTGTVVALADRQSRLQEASAGDWSAAASDITVVALTGAEALALKVAACLVVMVTTNVCRKMAIAVVMFSSATEKAGKGMMHQSSKDRHTEGISAETLIAMEGCQSRW